jgi:hypothetical protein
MENPAMPKLNRRNFLSALSAGGAMLGWDPQGTPATGASSAIKRISGSWFEFQHHATVEGADWNPECACFTRRQWEAKIKEIAEAGMEYLVLMATALYYRSFFPTQIFPAWHLACTDPLEAVLSAADKYGVKFFIGGGFYGDWRALGDWTHPLNLLDPVVGKKRLQAIEELAKLYGHHRSFYGWYWPNEPRINPYFSEEFIQYVNTCSQLARRVTPRARILIGPHGTRVARPDDKYVQQLQALDVDIIAYQDEVGVGKSTPQETPHFYEGLRTAHDRAKRSAIWADVEIFQFEGITYESALIPAPFPRVLRQLEAVSPFVERILVYQYQGMMNKPGSVAPCGRSASTRLYTDYLEWVKGAPSARETGARATATLR